MIFFPELKVFTALISPMVPMEIRSSMLSPVFSKRLAMYTTRRRLCSMRSLRAASSPLSSAPIAFSSLSFSRGGGRVSLPPM